MWQALAVRADGSTETTVLAVRADGPSETRGCAVRADGSTGTRVWRSGCDENAVRYGTIRTDAER